MIIPLQGGKEPIVTRPKPSLESVMSKGMEQKKESKKKPAKTQLEKRAEKKEKKEQRNK